MKFNPHRVIETTWLLMIVIVVALIVYGLTGCAATTPVRPVIDIQRPVLPEVQSAELECISWDAFVRLRQRDLALHQYAEELETIICEIAECPK